MLTAMIAGAALSVSASTFCAYADRISGQCEVTNTGSSVEMEASYEVPGTDGNDGNSGAGDTGGGDAGGGTYEAPSIETDWVTPVIPAGPPPERHDARPWPLTNPTPPPDTCTNDCTTPTEAVPAVSGVTITDLASFTPTPPDLIGEPFGFGITGAPTNLYTHADTHTTTGDLLGHPVTVRFTPTHYHFDHGDGTTSTTTTGGVSWETLGVSQFTPTDTTHIYDTRGTYPATVTVIYTAEIDTGTGWHPIPGILPLTSPTTDITVLEKRTALVQHTCIEDPHGPGCPPP
ncbi:hypothetical protein [Microbacterium sp. No. 7]|uniref:hypothetical protein n=1 Tax=Microbacterium sp. No. 7 TaxID=1714373 RepID=UPI0006D2376F|nr:hypothetical protein [Microbacterium sp. No. 7]